MVTLIIVMFIAILLKIPSNWVRNMTSDASIIVFCLFVISDIHIFLWCLRGESGNNRK